MPNFKHLSALRPTTLAAMYNDLNGVYTELRGESDVSDLFAAMQMIREEIEMQGARMVHIPARTKVVWNTNNKVVLKPRQ